MLIAFPPAPARTLPHLQLHGYPTVLVHGRVVPLKVKRALALLALLADAGQPLGRRVLAERLWPDADAATGRGRLRRLVHEMHGCVGSALVDADGDSLRLAAGVTSDLQATRAAIAAALKGDAAAEALAPLLAPGSEQWLGGFTLDDDACAEGFDERRREHRATLLRALERAAADAVARRDGAAAERLGARLLALEPCAEGGHVARMTARGLRGDEAGLETAYHEAAAVLRAELGVRPSARLEAAYADALALARALRPALAVEFVDTGAGEVAHVSWGRGPDAIVILWGLISNIEVALEEPRARAMLERLATRHRVVLLDRRGSGLSERVGVEPDAANAAIDINAVLDHLGIARAWLFGTSVGGTIALDYALRHPERTAGLVLYGTSARGARAADWPWAMRDEAFDDWIARLTDPACYAESLRSFAPSVADDPTMQHWYARLLRNAATRRSVVAGLRAYQAMDLRSRLAAIRAPTLVMQRRGDRIVPAPAARWLAQALPNAQLELMDGDDHFQWIGDADRVTDAVLRFADPRRSERLAA
jgi:pimeloyl-ACP methyl ester carboxylesterase/DNA-binding SARP family transcriptional activator